MLSADEHPGLIYCMLGVVVIVMTAIGLSVMMEKRNVLSSGASDLSEVLAWDREVLERLENEHAVAETRLTRDLPQRRAWQEDLAQQVSGAKALVARKEDLLGRERRLRADLAALESAFSGYRARYRNATWSGASGEKLGRIKLRGGREYLDAVIVRVTDVGLEIRHEDGFARLQAPDLSDELQTRFQWSDEERRKRLLMEFENQLKSEISPKEKPQVVDQGEGMKVLETDATTPQPVRKREEIIERRATLAAWKAKVIRLEEDIMEAAGLGGSARQTSIPGKLETWKAREARLRSELMKARTGLSLARSHLAEISPDDPALIIQEGEP